MGWVCAWRCHAAAVCWHTWHMHGPSAKLLPYFAVDGLRLGDWRFADPHNLGVLGLKGLKVPGSSVRYVTPRILEGTYSMATSLHVCCSFQSHNDIRDAVANKEACFVLSPGVSLQSTNLRKQMISTQSPQPTPQRALNTTGLHYRDRLNAPASCRTPHCAASLRALILATKIQ